MSEFSHLSAISFEISTVSGFIIDQNARKGAYYKMDTYFYGISLQDQQKAKYWVSKSTIPSFSRPRLFLPPFDFPRGYSLVKVLKKVPGIR